MIRVLIVTILINEILGNDLLFGTQVNKSDAGSNRIPGNGNALESEWKNPVVCCKFYERPF